MAPFGFPVVPGGEEDVGQVVGSDGGGALGGGVGRHRGGPGQEVGPAHGVVVGVAPHHHDLLEMGELAAVTEGLDVVGVEEVGDGEEHAGP